MGYALRNLIRTLAVNEYHDEFDTTAPVLHWPNSVAKDVLDILETEQLIERSPGFPLFEELANHRPCVPNYVPALNALSITILRSSLLHLIFKP